MDSDKWRVINLIANLLTPITLAIFGIWVSRVTKRFEYAQWKSQKLIEKRLSIYDQLAPELNDLLCYFTYAGNWKDLTPIQVVQLKRTVDKRVQLAAPLFSEEFYLSCRELVKACFESNSGFGRAALLRTDVGLRKVAQAHVWEDAWVDMFSAEPTDPIVIAHAYQRVMRAFALDIGVNEVFSLPAVETIKLGPLQPTKPTSTQRSPHNRCSERGPAPPSCTTDVGSAIAPTVPSASKATATVTESNRVAVPKLEVEEEHHRDPPQRDQTSESSETSKTSALRKSEVDVERAMFLAATGASEAAADCWIVPLRQAMERFEINTAARQAAFLAHVSYFSGGLPLPPLAEKFNYSVHALEMTFRKLTAEQRSKLGRQPGEKEVTIGNQMELANLVYAGVSGNGPASSRDGWRFRGSGLTDLTWRSRFAAASGALGLDLVGEPDLVRNDPAIASLVAAWDWQQSGGCDAADHGEVSFRRINPTGFGESREAEAHERARQAFGLTDQSEP